MIGIDLSGCVHKKQVKIKKKRNKQHFTTSGSKFSRPSQNIEFHTYSKHSNPPDVSSNLPLARFHKYSPDIENFHHKHFFCCQTAENDKKTLLHSRSLPSL